MTMRDDDQGRTRSESRTRAGVPGERRRLGEILVAGGAVTAAQVEHALSQQAELQLPLGQALLKLGYTTDEVMRQALSSQLGVPYIDLQNVIIDRSLATLLDREFALQHLLFPVARIGLALTIAMDDPTATAVVEELAATTGHTISVVTSSADQIRRALVRLYEKPPPKPVSPLKPETDDASSSQVRDSSEPVAASKDPAHAAGVARGPHGYAALLGLMTYELPDLLRSIEGGLAFRVFDRFVENTGLSADQSAEMADIARRTLAERREEGRFTRDESDRLVRAARVFGGALTLFHGDRATASAWLMSGQPALGGSTPLDLARTDLGAREVERVLASLERR